MYVYVENGRGQGTVDTCLSLQRGTPKSPTRRASLPHEACLTRLLGVPHSPARRASLRGLLFVIGLMGLMGTIIFNFL